jgi:nucleoside-diphosphate-sugar epimerase
MPNPLAQDLDAAIAHTPGLWEELRGARVFATGATGFFGCWLLETLLWANDRLELGASVVALTRDARAFDRKAPHLARHAAVTLHEGDARTFEFIEGPFSHVVHAATDSSSPLAQGDRLVIFDSIVEGTRRALEFARAVGAEKFLLTSSGAVYGRQPPDLSHVPEEYTGAPDPTSPAHAYAEGKRAAEMLCALYGTAQLKPTIARCFAFVGPYLPLDGHFAVGNFIRDALDGGPIRIAGDGSPWRSYLYAADLAVWLWTILLRGRPMRPYNVGSSDGLTIEALARVVADTLAPGAAVQVARPRRPGAAAERYVPAVSRAETELGLRATVPLAEGIRRTARWHSGDTVRGSRQRISI